MQRPPEPAENRISQLEEAVEGAELGPLEEPEEQGGDDEGADAGAERERLLQRDSLILTTYARLGRE
jgi:hypothetical protein